MSATFVSVEMTEEEQKYEEDALAFLLQKNVSSPKEFFDKLDNLGKNKLERLIKGDITSKKTTFRQEYQKFTHAVPVWNSSLDYGDHNVSKKIKTTHGNDTKISEDNEVINLYWLQFSVEQQENILVIRKQNSGLCYLHAPVVLEHYLIAISTACQNASMINIGIYEANLLDGSGLESFLSKDEGGVSTRTLQNICGLGLEHLDNFNLLPPSDPLHDSVCERIIGLVAIAPMLVSNFTVYKEFFMAGKFCYDGKPTVDADEKLERHAMVLIGARKSRDKKYYFLLQNWWENKYFIEVSSEYMYYCRGSITFINKVITRTLNLPTYIACYAETSIDAPESSFER